MLIDTHCHIDRPEFDIDREEVIERALRAGIGKMILVGTDFPSSQKAVLLAEKYPFFFAAVGLHPHDADEFSESLLSDLERLSHSPKVVAIGETGLDFYYNHASKESQIRAFSAQIGLAVQRRLPLVIHTREAWEESFNILSKVDPDYLANVGSVFHCFTGDYNIATRATRMGFLVSFSGIVTFPKTASLQEAASLVDPNFILLETDAPFLSPQGYRDKKRNEPARLTVTAEKVAALRGISLETLSELTTANANRLFRLLS